MSIFLFLVIDQWINYFTSFRLGKKLNSVIQVHFCTRFSSSIRENPASLQCLRAIVCILSVLFFLFFSTISLSLLCTCGLTSFRHAYAVRTYFLVAFGGLGLALLITVPTFYYYYYCARHHFALAHHPSSFKSWLNNVNWRLRKKPISQWCE